MESRALNSTSTSKSCRREIARRWPGKPSFKMFPPSSLSLLLALSGAVVSAFDQAQFMPRSGIAQAATDVPSPIIDLGYSQYEGFYNSSANWNVYRGSVSMAEGTIMRDTADTPQNPLRCPPEALPAAGSAPHSTRKGVSGGQ